MSRRRRRRGTSRTGIPAIAGLAVAIVVIAGLAILLWRGGRETSPETPAPGVAGIPTIDTGTMEPAVARAFEAARAAVRDEPTSVAAWGKFGAVSHAHDLYEPAEAGYRRAGQLAPEDFRWPYLLAIVRELRGAGADELTRLYAEAARLQPRVPIVHYRLGDALMRQGRLDEARTAYTRALETDPDLLVARLGLGQALLASGEAAEAIPHLEQVAASSHGDPRLWSTLARAYGLVGDERAASAAVARVEGERGELPFPDPVRYQVSQLGVSARHCYARATALMSAGKFAEALEQLRVVAEARPEDAEVQYRLGVSFVRTGSSDMAIRHLERALELEPDSPGAHFELGRLRWAAGEYEAAAGHLESVLESRPDLDEARELLRRAREAAANRP